MSYRLLVFSESKDTKKSRQRLEGTEKVPILKD